MKTSPALAVGDQVRSADDSSDVTMMKNTWRAVITQVDRRKDGPTTLGDDGHYYQTVGRWDASDEPFWADMTGNEPLSLRQLWSSGLVTDTSEKAIDPATVIRGWKRGAA